MVNYTQLDVTGVNVRQLLYIIPPNYNSNRTMPRAILLLPTVTADYIGVMRMPARLPA